MGTDGSVFFSGPKGVVRVHSFAQGNVERVAATIHGPLRLRGDVLYVMWRETSAVLRFQPRVVDTTPPKKSGGGFLDGPASRRKESMDIQLGYVGITDVAPISINNGNFFSSVVLALLPQVASLGLFDGHPSSRLIILQIFSANVAESAASAPTRPPPRS